ncbi:response regulator transcription factor [Mycoplasmatota bacterium]|nr:response regulator transcription factor [Mycoplasmatota bacterium]
MEKTILVVEDEPTIQSVVSKYFKAEGFNVITADDGFIALEKFNSNDIDLICLDIMMPHIDGWTVTETIRETSNIPIIIMTALSSEEDILKGYSYRIDDYITKPFNPKILVAKAKSLLHRISSSNLEETKETLHVGPIELNTETLLVKVDGKTIDISRTEFDLLKFLINNQGEVCTREKILEEVWGTSGVETRIVDTYIKKLRKLLGLHSRIIKTVFGLGYRFEVDK